MHLRMFRTDEEVQQKISEISDNTSACIDSHRKSSDIRCRMRGFNDGKYRCDIWNMYPTILCNSIQDEGHI